MLGMKLVVALACAYALYYKVPTIVLGKSIARAKKRIAAPPTISVFLLLFCINDKGKGYTV